MPRLENQDPFHLFVEDQNQPGKFSSSEFLVIGAGPPLLSQFGSGDVVYPIGIVQNFNLSQNKAIARIFEIGSKRSYFFPGKTIGAVSFGRPYYHQHSLLRLLMAAYDDGGATGSGKFDAVFNSGFRNSHKIRIPPGYENLFCNLASDLFDQPHGELIVMKDTDAQVLQAIFLEQCYIPSVTLACDAQGIIWQEAVQVQYERLMPVWVPNMARMTDPGAVFDNDNPQPTEAAGAGAIGQSVYSNV